MDKVVSLMQEVQENRKCRPPAQGPGPSWFKSWLFPLTKSGENSEAQFPTSKVGVFGCDITEERKSEVLWGKKENKKK